MKSLFVGFFLFSLHESSFAIIGNSQQIDGKNAPAVCRIVVKSKEGKPSICSGFLSSPTQITSAGHCAPKNFDWKKNPTFAECGQLEYQFDESNLEFTAKGNPILINGVKFAEKLQINNFSFEDSSNIGTFTLSRPSEAKPLNILKFDPHLVVSCKIVGYGINNSGFAGVVLVAHANPIVFVNQVVIQSFLKSPVHLSQMEIDFSKDSSWGEVRDIIKNLNLESLTSANSTPGDSGGPVICEFKDKTVRVVGIQTGAMIFKSPEADFDWLWLGTVSPF